MAPDSYNFVIVSCPINQLYLKVIATKLETYVLFVVFLSLSRVCIYLVCQHVCVHLSKTKTSTFHLHKVKKKSQYNQIQTRFYVQNSNYDNTLDFDLIRPYLICDWRCEGECHKKSIFLSLKNFLIPFFFINSKTIKKFIVFIRTDEIIRI